MKKNLLLIVILSFSTAFISAQKNIDTPNLSFDDGSLNGWKLYTGDFYYDNVSASYLYNWTPKTPAQAGSRISIIGNTSTTSDPIIACDGFYTNPDNKLVARLGVPLKVEGYSFSSANAAAERMEYSFKVTANTTLLSYKLAAVLRVPQADTSHVGDQRPSYSMEITVKDDNGVSYTLPCSSYSSKADNGNSSLTPNALPCPSSTAGTNAKDYVYQKWLSGNIDLSNQIGKTVTINIINHDCLSTSGGTLHAGAHEAYGYFWAETKKIELTSFSCENSDATIVAPQGFTSYVWTRSDGKSITHNPTQPWIAIIDKSLNFDGITYSCEMNDANSSCGAITISRTLNQVKLHPDFTNVAVEAGKIQFTSTSTAEGDSISDYFWEFGDGTTSNLQNPIHEYSQYIPYDVKLTVTSKQTCSKYIIHSVLPTKELIATLTPSANLEYNGQAKDFTATTNISGLQMNIDYYIRYRNRTGTPSYNSFTAPAIVGDYTATFELSYLSLIKYFMITVPSEDFSITKAPLTVTANNVVKIYGENITLLRDGFSQSMKPLYAGDKIYELELQCSGLSDTASVGTYTITPTTAIGLGVDNYDIHFVAGHLTVNPKPLTITATDNAKTYGDQITVAGKEFYIMPGSLVGNDTVLSVSLQSNGFDKVATVGTYPVTASGATGIRLSNYTISYTNSVLLVNKKKITVTAQQLSKTYGTVYTFNNKEFVTDKTQFVGNDSVSQVQLVSQATPMKAIVGDYSLIITGITGYQLDNYEIKLVNSTFKVNPMPVTIITNSKEKEYGDLFIFSGSEFTIDKPLITGDTILFVSLKSIGSIETAPIGMYDILASQAYGAGILNYDFTYTSGVLSVVKKKLTATIYPPANLEYNAKTKDFTAIVSISGLLQNTDYYIRYTNRVGTNPYNSFIAPTVVGDYSATFELSNLSLLKYAVDVAVSEDFSITKAPLTITAENATKTYGEKLSMPNDAFDTDRKPLYGADVIYKVDFDCVGFVDTASVGNYKITPINVAGSGIENYNVTYQDGNLIITPKLLMVKAVDGSKVYGDQFIPNPKDFYIDSRDLVGSDVFTSVTLTSDGYVNTAIVGIYPVKVSKAVGSRVNNYQILYADGSFQVTKKKITVFAKPVTKIYGSEYVFKGNEFQVDATQLIGTDSISGVRLNSQGTQKKASVGEYTLSITDVVGSGLDNYDIKMQNGLLLVTQMPIVVIANNLEKEYGDVFTFSGNEFTTNIPMLNNDTISFAFMRSNGSVESALIGLYDIIPSQASGAGSLNYAISYQPGKLSVVQKQLRVSAQNCVKEYGANDPEMRFSVIDKRGIEYQPTMFTGNVSRESGEKVGEYAITEGTLSVSQFYTYTFSGAKLTIKKALPTIEPSFTNNIGQFIMTDVFGNKNGDSPTGNLNIKIKQTGVEYTTAVVNGLSKCQVSGLPNQMVEAELNYLGDDNYLPTSKVMNIYAIIYNCNGGQLVSPIINFDGSESVKLETPTYGSNFRFEGWYEHEDFSSVQLRHIPLATKHDVNLYAKWVVTYDDLSLVVLFDKVIAVANPLNRDFLYNSTYKWYKDSVLLDTNKQYCGFENYVPTGNYRVEIYYLNNAPVILELNYSAIVKKSKAYPNPLPLKSELSLLSDYVSREGVSVGVYNLLGVRQNGVIVERDSDKFKLNGFTNSGIYIVRVLQNGSVVETHKVTVED